MRRQATSSRAERALQPLQALAAHDNDVEAHSASAQHGIALQQELSGEDDLALLACIDARRRAAKALGRACTDFNDRQKLAAARDDVELAATAREITRDDFKLVPFQQCDRAILSAIACCAPLGARLVSRSRN